VFHGDIQSGLEDYPAGSFDYVILNQSIQEVERVDFVIGEALRVGRKVVIGFPNFAYWKARFMLFFRGRAPITPSLPYHWYDTPNVRFLSVTDFREYCGQKNLHVLSSRYLGEKKEVSLWPNLFALNAIFLLTKAETPPV
ncbi:MAG TPA: methionine biosynthesis protein MetW, partial [Syntrophales bacterium]|nr:methionine biosynthesis protein MetW [Syntrophales bacterium]